MIFLVSFISRKQPTWLIPWICWLTEWLKGCFMPLSTVFQSYHGNSSHYSCISWVSPVLGWALKCLAQGHSHEKTQRIRCCLNPGPLDYESNTLPLSHASPSHGFVNSCPINVMFSLWDPNIKSIISEFLVQQQQLLPLLFWSKIQVTRRACTLVLLKRPDFSVTVKRNF